MSSIPTKDKILLSAVKLFNQHGLANVRLQMIANESGISIGNLAYHFKNKEAIIESMSIKLQNEFLNILAMYRQRQDLLDFDLQLDQFYQFINENPYYFVDAIDIKRSFPDVPVFKSNCVEKLLFQITSRFKSNVSKGLLNEEPFDGFYDDLGYAIWKYIVFLVPSSEILGRKLPSLVEFKKHIWMKFIPFLTENGKVEFNYLISPKLLIDIN